MRILVVENNEQQRRIAEKVLRNKKCDFFIAKDLLEVYIQLGEKEKVKGLQKTNEHYDWDRYMLGQTDWQAIIMRLNFPRHHENKAGSAPYGIELALYCRDKCLPSAIHTSLSRSDPMSLWLWRMCQSLDCGCFLEKNNKMEQGWNEVVDFIQTFHTF